jgi:hypothetical protein
VSDVITLQELRDLGWDLDDVRRQCPLAPEYGPTAAPYWRVEDLTALLGPAEERDA